MVRGQNTVKQNELACGKSLMLIQGKVELYIREIIEDDDSKEGKKQKGQNFQSVREN